MARHLYTAPLSDFLAAVDADTLTDELAARLQALTENAPGEAEVASWRHSLPALADVLRDPIFATGEIFVELFMPLNGRRCDALLAGHTAMGPSAVVVELKRWTFVTKSHLPDHVRAGNRNVVHPSVQVRDYVETLRHYHSAFTGEGEPIALEGAAFLHALPLKGDKAGLRDTVVFGHLAMDFPVFFEHEHRIFAQWLADRLVPGPGKPAAERIRSGQALPSPRLLDQLVECIKGQQDWRLLDEQKTAYFAIADAVRKAQLGGEKRVFVVHGGPGTGKSVLAIQLLAQAARAHWKVAHATGSKAFQTVLQARTEAFGLDLMKKLHGVKTRKALPVANLFATFADVARLGATEPDRLDLVVCDEAHRLWLHRRQKFPNGTVRWLSDRSMIDEVIAAARVSVFFLDDNQSVRSGEIGRSHAIVERAQALGIELETHNLDAQFRCAGSTSYIHWTEGLLGFRDQLDHEWRLDHAYGVRLWTDMPAMDAHLRGLVAQGHHCRLLAGFCWKWSLPDGLGQQPHDLIDPRFGTWSGAWIDKTEQNLKPLEHRYYHWATRDEAYEQVGSIYSVQGFEFDDVGLIWGEDLVWRTDKWVAQLDRNKDGTFKRDVRNDGADPLEKLRNVYRVLLTRGMRSTHLFVLDDETRAHLAACLAAPIAQRLAVGDRPPTGGPPLRLASAVFRPHPIEPDADRPWQSGVPILDFEAAAGGFSGEWRDLIDPGASDRWITWDGAPNFAPGDFVARVRGDSMVPLIGDGDWCLFRPAPVEQAISRPALVRLGADAPDGGQFSVKVVQLEWGAASDGTLVRQTLALHSHNRAYPPLRFTAADQADVRVLAIVVKVLGT